jgi:hypothetical protein
VLRSLGPTEEPEMVAGHPGIFIILALQELLDALCDREAILVINVFRLNVVAEVPAVLWPIQLLNGS